MIDIRKLKSFSRHLFLILLVLFTGFISCGNGNESSEKEWKYVGEVRDEKGKPVSVYIDLKNMQVNENIRKFWIRYYANKNDSEPEERYIRQKGFWEVDCQDRTLYVLEEEYYDPEGQVLGKSEQRKKEEYDENSIGSKLASAACRYAGRD